MLQAFPGHGLPHIYSVNFRHGISFPEDWWVIFSFMGVKLFHKRRKKTLHGSDFDNISEYCRGELMLNILQDS